MSTFVLPGPAVAAISVGGLLVATFALVVRADATRGGAAPIAGPCATLPDSARSVPAQPPTARFSLAAGPARRFVPRGTAVSAGQRLGSNRVVISGTSRVEARTIRRCGAVVLGVMKSQPFGIGGNLAAPLYPGAGGRLNLVLTNPHRFALRVGALTVRVRARTTGRACRGDVNYAVAQYSGRYPLVLRPGRTRLSALVGDSSRWPLVRMHDLPTNQDACKRAVLRLHFSGLATR